MTERRELDSRTDALIEQDDQDKRLIGYKDTDYDSD